MYLIPWVPTRASRGAVKARQQWLGNGTPQRHSVLPAQRACHQWCRVTLPQAQGPYYKMEAKSKLQIWPLNICICHLFRMPPMLSCHILFHHCTALKQAGTPHSLRAEFAGLITGWESEYWVGLPSPWNLQEPPRIECVPWKCSQFPHWKIVPSPWPLVPTHSKF